MYVPFPHPHSQTDSKCSRLSPHQSPSRGQERHEPERREPPLPAIPRSDGLPSVDRYIDYNRYTFASTTVPPASHEVPVYGYIAVHAEVVLGLSDAQRVVEDVSRELSERGEFPAFRLTVETDADPS